MSGMHWLRISSLSKEEFDFSFGDVFDRIRIAWGEGRVKGRKMDKRRSDARFPSEGYHFR